MLTRFVLLTITASCLLLTNATAADSPADRTRKLVAVLQSDAPFYVKARACQQLGESGDAQAVPALAALLADEHLSAYARSGLEGISDPSAAAALRTAAATLKGNQLVGVINSLGVLGDAQAIGFLEKLADDPASGVAKEALLALDRIGTQETFEIIRQPLRMGPEAIRADAAAACLLAAERQLADGDTKAAAALCDAVRDAKVPLLYRAAAVRGAIVARKGFGVPLLIEQLKSNERILRHAALLAIREIPSDALASALNAELAQAPAELQIQLLTALADCHNAQSLAVLQAKAASEDAAVRQAALTVLGRIGGTAEAGVLLKAVADNRSAEDSAIALNGLKRMEGAAIDAQIVKALASAIDGSKFKAVNNPRRHYTQEQLQELVQKVEARVEEYLGELDRQDTEAEGVPAAPSRTALEEKIAVLKARQGKYDELLAEMKAAQQTEVSLTDPDSRGMKKVAVGYNVQVAVDAKHHLIAAPEVVQAASDYGQLSPMATTAQAALAVTSLQVVADAGYHEAQQLEACAAVGLTTFVPARGTTPGQGPHDRAIHPKEAFTYDPVGDTYRCPTGQTLVQGYAGESRGKQCLYYYNVAACGACGAKGGLHHGRLSQTFAPGQRGRGRAAGPARAGASGAGAPAQGNRGTRLRDAPQLGPRHVSDERAGESADRIQPELPDLQPAAGAELGGDGRAAGGGGGGRAGRRGCRGLKKCGTSSFRPSVLLARTTPSLRRPARTRWGENFSARQTLLPTPRRGETSG